MLTYVQYLMNRYLGEKGQGLTEYAIILLLVVLIGVMIWFGFNIKAPYLRFTAELAVIYPALQLLREIKSDNGFISTVTRKLYFKELVKTASPREKLFFLQKY